MKDLRLSALLPVLLLGGLLVAGTASTPTADDGPVVQMTVSPSR